MAIWPGVRCINGQHILLLTLSIKGMIVFLWRKSTWFHQHASFPSLLPILHGRQRACCRCE